MKSFFFFLVSCRAAKEGLLFLLLFLHLNQHPSLPGVWGSCGVETARPLLAAAFLLLNAAVIELA
jgi:hypothetical protein